MAVEILRHGQSGELYAVQYDDGEGYATTATISKVLGPLTAAEAYEAYCDGSPVNLSTEDAEWARAQSWNSVDTNDLNEAARDAYNDRVLPHHTPEAVRVYIETYFDPNATLTGNEDPAEVLSSLDNLNQQQDGWPTPLDYSDVRDYLASLATIGR